MLDLFYKNMQVFLRDSVYHFVLLRRDSVYLKMFKWDSIDQRRFFVTIKSLVIQIFRMYIILLIL